MRLYLTNSAAPYNPATTKGAWTVQSSNIGPSALSTSKVGTNVALAASETSASELGGLIRQFVSAPFLRPGTISGVFSTVVSTLVNSTTNSNFVLYVTIWVTQGDSGTMRGGSLANVTSATTWTTTATARGFTNTALSTNHYVQTGDRLVVELGFWTTNTTTTTRTGTSRYGGTNATDLVLGDTTNVTSRSPWIDLPVDTLFTAPTAGTPVGSVSDNFNDNSLNGALWSQFGTGALAETNGRIEITSPSGQTNTGIATARNLRLANTSVHAQVTAASPGSAVRCESHLSCYLGGDFSQVARMVASTTANQLYTDVLIGGAYAFTQAFTYDPSAHAWLRMREDSGTLYFEASPDGRAWTTLTSTASPDLMLHADTEIDLEVFGDGAPAGPAIFDNLNVVPTSGGSFLPFFFA